MTTVPWIKEMLQRSGAGFEEHRHPAAFTAAEVAEQEHVSRKEVAKVVIAIVLGKPLALVLPASRRVCVKTLQTLLGPSFVRLATESEIQQYFPDCEVGAIPPLRHWEGIDVWADESMRADHGEIIFQAGTHEDTIHMRYDDWFRLVQPRVERFSMPKDKWLSSSEADEEEERLKDERRAAIPGGTAVQTA